MKYRVGDKIRFIASDMLMEGRIIYTSKTIWKHRERIRVKVEKIIDDSKKPSWSSMGIGNTPWIYLSQNNSIKLIEMKGNKTNKYTAKNGSKIKHAIIKI